MSVCTCAHVCMCTCPCVVIVNTKSDEVRVLPGCDRHMILAAIPSHPSHNSASSHPMFCLALTAAHPPTSRHGSVAGRASRKGPVQPGRPPDGPMQMQIQQAGGGPGRRAAGEPAMRPQSAARQRCTQAQATHSHTEVQADRVGRGNAGGCPPECGTKQQPAGQQGTPPVGCSGHTPGRISRAGESHTSPGAAAAG